MLDESDPEDDDEDTNLMNNTNLKLPVKRPTGEENIDNLLADSFGRLALESTENELFDNKSINGTCYVYDSFMCKHQVLNERYHVECPARITRIYKQLVDDQLLEKCQKLLSRFATLDEIYPVHDKNYVHSLIEAGKLKSVSEIIDFQDQFDSIYYCPYTYQCASLAAGSLLQILDHVLCGEAKNGFALIRPPGHHADSQKASGFCFFNNVALATDYALSQKFKICASTNNVPNCRRVLILDWDVHHGNGTQSIFYHRSDVLYISLHRYDNGRFYPGPQGHGDFMDVGEGPGLGFNINVPWSGDRMGDSEYLAAFKEIIMPIAKSYNPDLVIISAGFDAAIGDPLGGYKVTPACYAQMTRWLGELADGKLILALEGGYNLTSISLSFSACVETLISMSSYSTTSNAAPSSFGSPIKDGNNTKDLLDYCRIGKIQLKDEMVSTSPICKSARQLIDTSKHFLAEFWPCLQS